MLIGAAAYAFNAWRWGTIPDTSWLITASERVLAGDRLYVDLIETNPPFSIWLYTIPVRLAAVLGVAPEGVVRLYTILICLAGSVLTGWMLAASGILARRSAAIAAVALFAVAVLLSNNAFSQRDQIGAVLGLPLFVLAAWRALPDPTRPPGILHGLVAGAGAGVLAMVKPHYAVVVLAAACLLALKRRDIRAFVMPEFLLSGAITATYLGLIYALYQAFFETLLPLLRDTYMAYRLPLDVLLLIVMPRFALPAVHLLLRRLVDRPEPADFLMLAAAAALLPFFLQGKGWAYHAYPAILFGSAALIVNIAMLFSQRGPGPGLVRVLPALAAIVVAHLCFVETQKPPEALAAAGRQGTEKPTIGVLGGRIEIGHPLARMIGGRWIEPYCSDWPATYAVRRQAASRVAGDPAEARRYEAMASDYFAGKRARLFANPPQILIVDRDDGLVDRMVGKFGFQELLDRYDRIAAEDGVELYRLRTAPSQGLQAAVTGHAIAGSTQVP